jgi:hypothetical protein
MRLRFLLPLFLLALLLTPVSAGAAMSETGFVEVPFGSGQAPPASSFLSPDGSKAYFGMAAGTGSAFSIGTSPLSLPVSVAQGLPGDNNFQAAVRSPDGQYGYFSANDGTVTGARVVKVLLSDMTRDSGASLGFGQQQIWAGGISPDGNYGYWATWNQDGSFGAGQRIALVKFNLATMSPVSKLALPDSDVYPTSVLVSNDGNTAWLGAYNGKIVKVNLQTMTRVSDVDLLAGENQLQTGVRSSDGTYGYFVTGSTPAKLVKVNLQTMTRIGSVALGAGQNNAGSAGISPDGSYAYIATNTDPVDLVSVRLSDMTVSESLTLSANEEYSQTMAVSPDGQFAYVGSIRITPSLRSLVGKVQLANKYTLSVSKSGSGAVSGSGIDCGATCSLSRLDYQDLSFTLTATPSSGQVFSGWSGACSGTGSCQLTLDQDKAVTANFAVAPGPDPGPGPSPGPTPSVSVKSLKAKLSKKTAYLTSAVTVSGAGKISQVAVSGKKSWCKTSKSASKAGSYQLRCNLGRKGRSYLRKRRLSLSVTTSLAPTSGSAVSVKRSLKISKRR